MEFEDEIEERASYAGKIDLDAPVQNYLPEFTLADPEVASQITVRHLLNQTSGLSEIGFADMALPQPETIEERAWSSPIFVDAG